MSERNLCLSDALPPLSVSLASVKTSPLLVPGPGLNNQRLSTIGVLVETEESSGVGTVREERERARTRDTTSIPFLGRSESTYRRCIYISVPVVLGCTPAVAKERVSPHHTTLSFGAEGKAIRTTNYRSRVADTVAPARSRCVCCKSSYLEVDTASRSWRQPKRGQTQARPHAALPLLVVPWKKQAGVAVGRAAAASRLPLKLSVPC